MILPAATLMIATVGVDGGTGVLRFTFGSPNLYDGIDFVVVTLGLFAVLLGMAVAILMGVELMLTAVNINLVAFSIQLGDMTGQVFAMFVLTVAAAEAAIGLAILVCFFRNRGTIDVSAINAMKG